MEELSVSFQYELKGETLTVEAYGKEINQYGCEDLMFDIYDQYGNIIVLYDGKALTEIEEIANTKLYEIKFHGELNF